MKIELTDLQFTRIIDLIEDKWQDDKSKNIFYLGLKHNLENQAKPLKKIKNNSHAINNNKRNKILQSN